MCLWLESFEDHLVGQTPRNAGLLAGAHRPGEQRQTPDMLGKQRCEGWKVLHRIGDEVWTCAKSMQEMGHSPTGCARQRRPLLMAVPALGDDSAWNAGLDRAQSFDLERIEGHDRNRSRGGGKDC